LICLDEADELLRPSFLDEIREVLEVAQSKQVLMFSATISDDVKDVVDEFMKDPVNIDLTKGQKLKVPENVKQFELVANKNAYPDIIANLINKYQSQRCIVFVNRKVFASELCDQLYELKIRSRDLHSDHSQTKRERVFKDFKTGKFNVLVATDVAARGLDVPEIDLIIHGKISKP
jgi:superfamily II DNA/RNA helicase